LETSRPPSWFDAVVQGFDVDSEFAADSDEATDSDEDLSPLPKVAKQASTQVQILDEWRARLRKAEERMKRPKFIKFKDKVSFTLGVVNFGVVIYLTGALPGLMPVVYSAKLVLLIFIRLYLYRKEKWGYFLLDFCYFANLLMLLYLWAAPGSSSVFKAVFAVANGPLGVAIIAWRNSLVFHSLDKTTSLFIHIEPPLLCYIIRHNLSHDPGSKFMTGWEDADYGLGSAWWDMVVQGIVVYMAWQLMYFVKVQVLDLSKIRRQNHTPGAKKYITSFTTLREDKGLIGKLIRLAPQPYQHYMFGFIQLVYSALFLAVGPLLYFSPVLHFSWLVFLGTWSAWNGSCFYVEVFSKRYQEQLQQLEMSSAAVELAASFGPSAKTSPDK